MSRLFLSPSSATLRYVMPTDDAGRVLNANFSIEADGPYLALILESAGGRSSNGLSRNLEYPKALTLLLTRLRDRNATLYEALLDSRRTWHLPEEDRKLSDGPIRLKGLDNMDTLRLELTRRQAKVGQGPTAKKGGNSRKRMRLRLEVPGFTPADTDRLTAELAGDVPNGDPQIAPRTSAIAQSSSGRRGEDLCDGSSDSPRHLRHIQDARLRQAIERHAVNQAIEHYVSLGYRVDDVGTQSPMTSTPSGVPLCSILKSRVQQASPTL
jgi:hypothetical protein